MRKINLDYVLFEEQIQNKLYAKAQNNPEREAIFETREINPQYTLDSNSANSFIKWLFDKGIIDRAEIIGDNSFRFIVNEMFLQNKFKGELKGIKK